MASERSAGFADGSAKKLTASLQQHQGQSSPAPDDELKRLRTKNTSLKAKVAQIEHELRRKETLVEEMQSKLQKISAKVGPCRYDRNRRADGLRRRMLGESMKRNCSKKYSQRGHVLRR